MNEIPSTWTTVTLGEIATSIRNGISEKPVGERGQPILRISAVRPSALDLDDVRYLPDPPSSYADYALHEGDLLFTRYNGSRALVGVCAVVPPLAFQLVYPDKLIRVRVHRAAAEPKYLQYALNVGISREHIEKRARTTAGQTGVSGADLRSMPIALPPLAEQRRIVAVLEEHLSDLDAAVAGLERARTRLTCYKQAVIDRGTAEGDIATLSSLLREPLRNGHSAPRAADGLGVRVFSISAVTEGDFSERNTKIAAMNPARVESLWAAPGDIFVQRSNTPELVGTARIYRGPERFAVFPDLLIRVRTKPEALPEYVELVLRSTPVRRYYRSVAQGIAGSMPKIDQGAVERTAIPLPSRPQQREIVESVSAALTAADRTADELKVQLARAMRLRRALFERAFRGDLVPQDPGDEPVPLPADRIVPRPLPGGSSESGSPVLARRPM